tara:strand:- start:11 stop:769 length:759 start_codon:yes stop_codon:yes gene_type:complete
MKIQIDLINNLRKKILNKYSIGCWIQIPSLENLEIILENKYDWFCIDYEHGFISQDKLGEMISLINKSNKIPFVRLASTNSKDAIKIIEAGASGIIIPQVKNISHVKKIIDICNYPPLGSRGIGFSRANRFGKELNYQIKKFKPIIVAMIETKSAVENLDKILKLDGLDAIFIGPYDLSASYKVTGKFKSKKFQNILKQIKKVADKNKIACGMHIVRPNKDELKSLIKKKFKFLAYSMDSVIIQNYYQYPLK